MAKNIFFEGICDGVLCEEAESLTNKEEEEEAKTVEKSRFVELSENVYNLHQKENEEA